MLRGCVSSMATVEVVGDTISRKEVEVVAGARHVSSIKMVV